MELNSTGSNILFLLLLCASMFIIDSSYGQTCSGTPYNYPGSPSNCTYTYTSSGWFDNLGLPTTKPNSVSVGETLCILSNNSEDFTLIKGTFYLAAGATYSGSINGFNNGSTLLIEGNFDLANNTSFNSTSIFIESTGSFTYPVAFAPGGATVVKNNGSFLVNGDLNISGSSSLFNFESASLDINGDASINNTLKNCGIMYVYGGINGSGGSGLENYCSLYVQQDISLNGDFTSDGLIIIDGSLDVNGSTFYNNDVLILTNLNLTNDHIVGNDQTSLLIVRQHSELSNGSSITGHLFYDEDDGGGFDAVCGSCTEDVDIVFDINMPTATEEIMNNCGSDVIVNPFIEESKLDFDGIDDYVSTAQLIDGMDSITIMAWVKYDVTGTTMTIASEDRACKLQLLNGNKPRVAFNTQGFILINATAPSVISPNEWHHIAGSYSNSTGDVKLYVDGQLVRSVSSSATTTPLKAGSLSNGNFEIGRLSSNVANQEYFKGDIDEVRLFDEVLTDDQIQKMVYQEIGNNAGNVQGAVIAKDIEDNTTSAKVAWNNLIAYYPMTNIISFSRLKDFSSFDRITKMHNIESFLEETAPLPYTTIADGDWSAESTWLHGDVWDIENAAINKTWSIVKIADNVTTSSSHENLGLIIEPSARLTVNGDNLIKNNWYLDLGGVLDLKDDSQLIQSNKSDLVTSATGRILRRQEGNSNYFWYNYWSSPVGISSVTNLSDNNGSTPNANNTNYQLDLLKDESETLFQFTNSVHETGKISTYWLFTYKNGLTYYDWEYVAPSTALEPGVGYTQKGTGNAGAQQQYIFEGKPNNGTIHVNVTDVGGPGSTPSVSKTDYLLGNPYPSALDIHKFIDDNVGVIDGTLQLWQQWSGSSHNLNQYNGGYAQVNKLGSVRAYQFVGLEGANNGSQDGITTPSRYLPVGQGFVAEIVADGTVEFNNDQRIFIKEADADGTYNNGSAFFRSANTSTNAEGEENTIQKIRLELNSVNGPTTRRELLLGFSDTTTDDFDYGYEALNTESGANDLNLNLDGDNYVMQAYSPITEEKEIPLNFKSSGDYFYEIKITETENVAEDQDIYIRDTYTETIFKLSDGQSYEFSATSGEFNDRFQIVFREQTTLSVVDQEIEALNYYYSNTRDKLVVMNPKGVEIKSIQIFNILGQSVYNNSNTYQQNYSEYPITDLSTGTYVVNMNTESGVLNKKIIIN